MSINWGYDDALGVDIYDKRGASVRCKREWLSNHVSIWRSYPLVNSCIYYELSLVNY